MKHKAEICFYCMETFKSWEDKHVHRTDTKKKYNFNNTVVLCSFCKHVFIKNNIKIHELVFEKGHIAKYFKPFGRKRQHEFIRKIKHFIKQHREIKNDKCKNFS